MLLNLYTSGPRQQRNGATHLIDASAVYGSNRAKQNSLRTLSGGRMKIQSVGGKVLLPPANSCSSKDRARQTCPFSAGDGRVGVTRELSIKHDIYLTKELETLTSLFNQCCMWKDMQNQIATPITLLDNYSIFNRAILSVQNVQWRHSYRDRWFTSFLTFLLLSSSNLNRREVLLLGTSTGTHSSHAGPYTLTCRKPGYSLYANTLCVDTGSP